MRPLPERLNVLSVSYQILYFDSPIDVGKDGKENLAYQWDKEDDIVRVLRGNRSWKSVTHSLWAVALEIICEKMIIEFNEKTETIIPLLATGLNTVMFYIGDAEGLEEEGKGTKLGDETEGKK